jgi:hypothetical protein
MGSPLQPVPWVALFAALPTAVGDAQAQPAPALKLAAPSFTESYVPAGRRSVKDIDANRAIVGLHLGRAQGPFQMGEIRAALKGNPAKEFCVRIASGDARYRSLNPYRREGADPDPRLETISRYGNELSTRYQSGNMPVQIMATAECTEGASGALIPAIPPGAQDRDTLVVFVNSVGSRASAELVGPDGKTVATGRCMLPTQDATLLYSEVCEVPLGKAAGTKRAKLRLGMIGSDAKRIALTFDVALPTP